MTPHCLILSCLPRMHVSFVSLPSLPRSPPFPRHRDSQRTGEGERRGYSSIQSPTHPLSNLVLCGVIFLQRRLFCKTLFPLSDI